MEWLINIDFFGLTMLLFFAFVPCYVEVIFVEKTRQLFFMRLIVSSRMYSNKFKIKLNLKEIERNCKILDTNDSMFESFLRPNQFVIFRKNIQYLAISNTCEWKFVLFITYIIINYNLINAPTILTHKYSTITLNTRNILKKKEYIVIYKL